MKEAKEDWNKETEKIPEDDTAGKDEAEEKYIAA